MPLYQPVQLGLRSYPPIGRMSKATITLTVDDEGNCHVNYEVDGDDAGIRSKVRTMLNALAREQAKENLDG